MISYQGSDNKGKPVSAGPGELPAPGEGKRGPAGHLAYLLRQAAAGVTQALEGELAELGVTAPQFAALTVIDAYEGLSGADLARLTLLTPQTVNVITRNLERRGAIVREPDGVHGRILRMRPTAEGRVLLEACKARVAPVERQIAAELGAGQEAMVRDWLVSLARLSPPQR